MSKFPLYVWVKEMLIEVSVVTAICFRKQIFPYCLSLRATYVDGFLLGYIAWLFRWRPGLCSTFAECVHGSEKPFSINYFLANEKAQG